MENNILIIPSKGLSFDNFTEFAQPLMKLMELYLVERQCDADLHTWRVEFEGTPLLLRGDHYTECLWLEAQDQDGCEVLMFLQGLLAKYGFF